MTTIPTRTGLTSWLAKKSRAAYLRWRLAHVEKDVASYKLQVSLCEGEAQEIRCELAQLGAL